MYKLYTAGPIRIPHFVQSELNKPLIFHRDSEFISLYNKMISGLQYILCTQNDVLAFTASGTGGMEAAICNILSPKDKVLVIEQGKFSNRWSEICECFGLNITKIVLPWRVSIEPEQLKKALYSNNDFSAVLLTHCETSTGALNNIRELSNIVHRHSSAILIIDAMSSIGAVPLEMDKWNVDVVVFSSNKGIMNPPGLAFVSLNEAAWERVRQSCTPRYYFDFLKMKKTQMSGKGTVYTPAIPIIRGVFSATEYIRKFTIQKIWERNSKLAYAFRNAVQSIGLNIWPPLPSDSLTVIEVPESLGAIKIKDALKNQHSMVISGGQGELKEKVIRIGHYGELNPNDYSELLSAIGYVLTDLNWNIEREIGVNVFHKLMQS
ncbi:alanine--glyoxylate aminotransferase family protein [bacterium]|nr:alanine--glyoxylate aminotransferase family protein [candidate division CSSED10-310 bacterium]